MGVLDCSDERLGGITWRATSCAPRRPPRSSLKTLVINMTRLTCPRIAAQARRGFTLIEILVVVGILALLIALILPVMSTVRETARETNCASNLRQLAAATHAYLAAWRNHLPQKAATGMSGEDEIIGALFGGKRGELEVFGINEYGVNERPLNPYVTSIQQRPAQDDNDPDSSAVLEQDGLPVFESPVDRGQPENPDLFLEYTPKMYDYLGTSYLLNDHTLDGEEECTLVPRATPKGGGASRPGGRMPNIADPTRTWMIGTIPIYNFQEGLDRGQRWAFGEPRVNLAFIDGHVGQGIETPDAIENTTNRYTFLPKPTWSCWTMANP